MGDLLLRYRELETRLAEIRKNHAGRESPEEEKLMDQMEALWWELSEEEKEISNREPLFTQIK